MKRALIAAAAALTMTLAVPALGIEDSQPIKQTGMTFEQMKDNHLKKLDHRIKSLQEEKTCVQAAKDQTEMKACRSKHKSYMKPQRDEMRKGKGQMGPGVQAAPPVN